MIGDDDFEDERGPRSGRKFLQETQPEAFEVVHPMAVLLTARLEEKPWLERAYLVDAFVQDLLDEVMDGEGPAAFAALADGGTDAESIGLAEQTVASLRAVLTAALLDLPSEEDTTDIATPEHAILFLISADPEFVELGRGYTLISGVPAVLEALQPFPGLIALMIADRISGPSIEPLTSAAELRRMFHGAA